MESKKSKIIGISGITCLVIIIVVFRLIFGLSRTFLFILGASIAGIITIITCFLVEHLKDRKLELESTSQGQELRIEYSFLRKVGGLPTKFLYQDIIEATDNFRVLLGRGASASVFKGILEDGTLIAVKRIERTEHGEREFKAEVSAIASVQHLNLVRLFGYCSVLGGGPRLLVYEYIHNKSLDNWIFSKTTRLHHDSTSTSSSFSSSFLSWKLRYRVAIDVAKALSYLHNDCRSRILHLDVKPENILLDENFRALVSDFGLSKLMGRDESRVYTTIRGTKGYLAPEWLLEYGISEKSDVYSYGMVLLEMVGGRRNVTFEEHSENSRGKWSYLPRIVVEKMKQGKLMEIVDKRLLVGKVVLEKELRTLVYVALWCIQEDPKLRPSMARVVDMLEDRLYVEDPPESEMIVVDLLLLDQDDENSIPVVQRRVDGHVQLSNCSFSMSCLSGR